MKQEVQCQSWKQRPDSESKQKTMTDKNKCASSNSGYLVESFTLNSTDRVISRKGKGRGPDLSFKSSLTDEHQLRLVVQGMGKKVHDLDLMTLTRHFEHYIQAVNLLLHRVYVTPERAAHIGRKLSEYRGRAYTFLRNERDLCYEHNDEIKALLYERLHRNALEQVGRIVLANYTRRQLVIAAIGVLRESFDQVLSFLRRKRIHSALIRKVRDSCDAVKNNGAGYHYALSVLRQVRRAIDIRILESLDITKGWRSLQRKKVASLLKQSSSRYVEASELVKALLSQWTIEGYPFNIPQLQSCVIDFSASTENSTGQGYWFTLDDERENEVLLHLKLPPGIDGTSYEGSPYKGKTLTFRFLDWLPRAAAQDRRKAEKARKEGRIHRAEQLRFRAAKFEDMHLQLMTTIRFQHAAYELTRLKQRKGSALEEINRLQTEVSKLKDSRRSAPPRLLLRGRRVTLQIPFLSPNGTVSKNLFGEKEYIHRAGVDRGLRAPVAISVGKEDGFIDYLVTVEGLLQRRTRLRRHAYRLTSELTRMRNNWDRKRSGQSYPGAILKRDRHVAALWRKVRRLDREVARLVASKVVWFLEEHRVGKVYFEDLRSFQAHGGSRDLSYDLSSNLWGKIIDTVRYMREQLGHSPYSVWTVNPRYTSQTCHQCGERGIRVEDEGSTTERKGGEWFYCEHCDEHFHADVNAARNIMHVQDSSAVPGGTTGLCPGLSNLQ